MTTPTRQPEQPANTGMTAAEVNDIAARVIERLPAGSPLIQSVIRLATAARQSIPPAPTSGREAEIIAKLPRTADGVPITPGMKVFAASDYGSMIVENTVRLTLNESKVWHSTREAAATSRGQQAGKGE